MCQWAVSKDIETYKDNFIVEANQRYLQNLFIDLEIIIAGLRRNEYKSRLLLNCSSPLFYRRRRLILSGVLE